MEERVEAYRDLNVIDRPGEVWKDIPNYERYQVSSHGRIKVKRSFDGSYILQSSLNSGYVYGRLYHSNKSRSFRIHRLVASLFIENPENMEVINHLNGIKTDNYVENLQWTTPSGNMKHAYTLGLKKPTRKIS